jgi:hypothetical protein
MQDNYQWCMVQKNGARVTSGEDISSAASIELTAINPALPNHLFTGLSFVRRFCRGFVRGMGGGMKEYLHCIVCKECRIYVFSSTGMVTVTPPDFEVYL